MGQTHCDADGMLLLQRPPPLSLQSTKAVWALPSALLFTLGLQRPPGYLSFSTTVGGTLALQVAALDQALPVMQIPIKAPNIQGRSEKKV